MKMLDIVLTSLVNNDYIMDRLIEDINNRFKVEVDRDKLVKYLSSYEHNQSSNTVNAW